MASTKTFDMVSSNLKIIAKYYPDNLDQALLELTSPHAPKSLEEIGEYIKNQTAAVFKRFVMEEEKYFQGVEDEEIEEKIFPSIRTIFEKNPRKLIAKLPYPSDEEKGRIKIQALFTQLYETLDGDKLKQLDGVMAHYGHKSMPFNGIDADEYDIDDELCIVLHPDDISDLFRGTPENLLELFEKDEFRTNYRVEVDPNGKYVNIFIEKPLEIKTVKPVVLEEKVRKVEPPKPTPAKAEPGLIGEKKPSLEGEIEDLQKILGGEFASSHAVKLKLEKIALDLIKTYGQMDDGKNILGLCLDLENNVKPQRSLLEQDTLVYKVRIMKTLNEVSSKLEEYEKNVKVVER